MRAPTDLRVIVDEAIVAADRDWVCHPLGAFRRRGGWFVDVTKDGPAWPYECWRVTAVPAVLPVNPRPARNGRDPYRHDPDPDPAHATVLGEFITYARAIRAGNRWLAAQDRRWQPTVEEPDGDPPADPEPTPEAPAPSDPRTFHVPLWLTGWSKQSLWGYDGPTGTYFAQLWRDGESGDGPAVRGLDGIPEPIGSRVELGMKFATATAFTISRYYKLLPEHAAAAVRLYAVPEPAQSQEEAA